MSSGPVHTFLVPSGYNFRAVLAFCRALRQTGHIPAILACGEDDPIFRTRFAPDVVFTRSGNQLELDDFAAAIEAARRIRVGLKRFVLAPASEFLVRWALRNRESLAAVGCDVPLPDEATYLRVTDKESFTAFCRAQGLPVPRELSAPSTLPCVAKPRWNVAPDGRSLYPWLLRTPADVARFKAETRSGDFFFQEWVEGRSFYLLFHLPKRGAATLYSQENLAQQPGGKSILLARPARLHGTAEGARWEGALRAAGFHGLVMVELRQRGDECVLIEANPRLWGPLQLCLDGCPVLLHRYIAEHTGGSIPGASLVSSRGGANYLWSGGLLTANGLVWLGRTPRFPRLALLRHMASDVYLRSDSWRQWLHERRSPAMKSRPSASHNARLVPAH